MGRVLTNNVSLAYSIESSLNVAGAVFKLLEPNTINAFGSEITKVARTPISKNRQRRKGTTTDLDSSVEIDHDITMSSFLDFIEGYAFSRAKNIDLDLAARSITSSGELEVITLIASQVERLKATSDFTTLLSVKGLRLRQNNGLFALGAVPPAEDSSLQLEGSFVEEQVPPTNAKVELAGVRFTSTAGVAASFAEDVSRLALTNSAEGFSWLTLGLTVGQMVCIGSPDSEGEVQNAMQAGEVENSAHGLGRIVTMTETTLTLDKVDASLQGSLTPGAVVDVLFGKFIRNVSIDSPDFLERSFQFEAEFPNLGGGGATEYEYALGNYCNSAAFNLPLTDKATVTYGFIGTDTQSPTTERKTGAVDALQPVATSAYNTSTDIARLRLQDIDEDGLSTDFKTLSITINNNVSPEKVLGTLGAKYMNTGTFEVNIEAQMLFTNSQVIQRIRDNETVTMDFAIRNEDGGIVVDIPAMTLGGGGREYPENETVLVNTTAEAFEDRMLGTSLGISVFPVLI